MKFFFFILLAKDAYLLFPEQERMLCFGNGSQKILDKNLMCSKSVARVVIDAGYAEKQALRDTPLEALGNDGNFLVHPPGRQVIANSDPVAYWFDPFIHGRNQAQHGYLSGGELNDCFLRIADGETLCWITNFRPVYLILFCLGFAKCYGEHDDMPGDKVSVCLA